MIANRFGKRAVANLPFEDALELRIAPRDRVADDDEIDVAADVIGGIAGHDWDVFGREEIAHRRVDVLIRAAHVVAAPLQQRRERGHRGPADANQVDDSGSGIRDSGFACLERIRGTTQPATPRRRPQDEAR